MSHPSTSKATGVGDLIQVAGLQALKCDGENGIGGYVLEKVLGIGGMGATVYLGRSESKRPPEVAIKVLPKEFVQDGDTARRFRRESAILKGIPHKHIVQTIDVGIAEDGSRYIAMEYMSGGTLASILSERSELESGRAVRIVVALSSALAELHSKGITHRDIKPGNVLLDGDGTPKLADFGLARFVDPTTLSNPLTQTGDTLGTVAYMAPEQVGATKRANARSDIYSLGVVLYQALTGIMPVGRVRSLADVRPELEHLDSVVMRAIEAEPERRFGSAEEFRRALERAYAQGKPKKITRRRVLWSAAVVGGCAAASKLWPSSTEQAPFWTDLDEAQRRIELSDSTNVRLRLGASDASLVIHRSSTPLSYRIEAKDVPDAWQEPLTLRELMVDAPLGLTLRCGIKSAEVLIPPAARGESGQSKVTLANTPDAEPASENYRLLYQTAELLNQLSATGGVDRNADRVALNEVKCPDFSTYCQLLRVEDLSAAGVRKEEERYRALVRIGTYQFLRTAGMPPHPALGEEDDFSIGEWTARSRLEVVAALIAEPWLLSKANESIVSVYRAGEVDSPVRSIVHAWLGLA